MSSKPSLLLLLFAGVFLQSCAMLGSRVTAQELADADFGVYPENYKELVRENLYHTLIDPNSLMLEFTGLPYKGYCYAPTYVPKGEHFGYGICLRVNAKNKMGGYTGWKDYVAYIRNGKVYEAFEVFSQVGHTPDEWVMPVEKIKVQ